MKTVGVIPARWQSTRLPGKILVEIGGKPLIQWVLESASRAKRLDALLVATDDTRIADTVSALGYRAVMTSPTHPSGTDRVAEAVAEETCDVVVNVQGDEPFIDAALIDALVGQMEMHAEWDMVTAAAPIRSEEEKANPSVVKVLWNKDHEALYFSRSTIPFVRDEAPEVDVLHWRHIGIYGYRRAFLADLVAEPPCVLELSEKLEQLRALYLGARIGVVETNEVGIGIDTPEDVLEAERILAARAD